MRIAILAIGTLGDVLPYIALGAGLKKAGHSMVIATHPSFKKTVTDYGLDFSPIEYPQELMTGADMLKLVDAGSNFLSWMRKLSNLTEPILRRLVGDCWQVQFTQPQYGSLPAASSLSASSFFPISSSLPRVTTFSLSSFSANCWQ